MPSGQSAQRVLTLTNTSATTPLNIRRITSEWPTSANDDHNVAGQRDPGRELHRHARLQFSINQTGSGSSSPPSTTDSGTLVIESDAASSPDLIDLTGSSTPVTVASPSNTAPLAAFTASQNSLSFASTTTGSVSSPQTLTLDNTGTATLTIFGIRSTPDFPVTSNCSTIVPGASCTLAVTFAPQPGTAATRVGAIEISSNASTSLEFISLIGVSSPPDLSLTPTPLNFGTILVGTTATLPVQLTNRGSVPAILSSLSATGDSPVGNGSMQYSASVCGTAGARVGGAQPAPCR